ncbi:type 4a pilus biogenesis protein PilO [Chitinilyticum piscinae]|uniref:Type 4a pilus biogenesis protein PilO n=1 Tax=Chitinilyticum piscinae TaxID=2866724 RepID=A0A8J7FHK3_9NEIS|nr:type 4a pilus biogenesis protein PilO [Chitinilyticum piscinae]MBE9607892.1 type 4a pilus biogenesis protein PilO [Chitinilyticum piscinae]
MTLDELRGLDPKDVANWPLAVQLVALAFAFILTVGAGYYFVWGDQIAEIDASRLTEVQLKEEFIKKKSQAINLEAYKAQLDEIQRTFGALLKQLPSKADMESLLKDINQAGVGRGLKFVLFKPATEIKTAEFAQMPIDIELNGSFHDLAAFVSDVSQLPRIVTISDLMLFSGKDKDSSLVLKAKVNTYRALDEAELQSIRQAEAESKKKSRR